MQPSCISSPENCALKVQIGMDLPRASCVMHTNHLSGEDAGQGPCPCPETSITLSRPLHHAIGLRLEAFSSIHCPFIPGKLQL